jgi:hypothetical protein
MIAMKLIMNAKNGSIDIKHERRHGNSEIKHESLMEPLKSSMNNKTNANMEEIKASMNNLAREQ